MRVLELIVETIKVVHSPVGLQERCMCSSEACFVEANCARQVIVQEIMIHKLIVETTNVVHSRAGLQERCMCSPGDMLVVSG